MWDFSQYNKLSPMQNNQNIRGGQASTYSAFTPQSYQSLFKAAQQGFNIDPSTKGQKFKDYAAMQNTDNNPGMVQGQYDWMQPMATNYYQDMYNKQLERKPADFFDRKFSRMGLGMLAPQTAQQFSDFAVNNPMMFPKLKMRF